MRLFVDNLTNIDFSYLCPKRGLVGETWLAHIELTGEPDQQGMICDFGIVKRQLRQWLDQNLDHCLLVPIREQAIEVSASGEQVTVSLSCTDNSSISVEAPNGAVSLMEIEAITPSLAAKWCGDQLKHLFPNAKLSISFSCEEIHSPYYHYSHGLKKHEGDCQRIAHGHRSKLLIWRNGVLATSLMEEWARRWSDIYLATKEDCIKDSEGTVTFEYRANQGQFRLNIPRNRCYIIDTDTTVEYIAQHLANQISAVYPEDHFIVKAFEGVGKGAIAEALGTTKEYYSPDHF